MDFSLYPSSVEPRKIRYGFGDKNQIVLPDGAPFDGLPVLIRLAAGWVEAWWEGSDPFYDAMTGDHDDHGFCWVCLDDTFQVDLDDALEWLPMEARGDNDGN